LKLFFFTQYFWPENFRINELVKYFSKNKPFVLTSNPSYPSKNLFINKKYFRKKLQLGNFEIIRVPVFLRNVSNLSIFLNYISFFLSSLLIGIFKIYKKKFDIIFVFCPSPILNAIPAIIFKKLFKKKIILWVLDLWPDTVIDLKIVKSSYLIWFLRKLVSYIYNNSDLILAQSKSIKSEIKKLTKTKCIYFPSWPEEFKKNKKNKAKEVISTNKLKILFAGNIGEAQSFETLIKCAKSMRYLNIVKWIIVGDGRWKKKLMHYIKINNLENQFQLISNVPLKKIDHFYNCADALYLSLKNNKTFRKTVPGKLQTYMSTGKPIIASISGEAKEIIIDSKCGYVSDAEDYKMLKKNIIKFSKLKRYKKLILGKNGKKYSDKNFSKKQILKGLEKEIKLTLS
jgi:glycosyltransferase involved in cell wall biosynthesis